MDGGPEHDCYKSPCGVRFFRTLDETMVWTGPQQLPKIAKSQETPSSLIAGSAFVIKSAGEPN
jgi:hypothetical protein